jgi:hypothetical protein
MPASDRETRAPFFAVEADDESLIGLHHGPPDGRGIFEHHRDCRRRILHRGLFFRVEFLPRRAAPVEQRLPAGLRAPAPVNRFAQRRRLLEVDETIGDAMLGEPGARS